MKQIKLLNVNAGHKYQLQTSVLCISARQRYLLHFTLIADNDFTDHVLEQTMLLDFKNII